MRAALLPGLLLTSCALVACAPRPPPRAIVQQAELRHCTADAPSIASLGLTLQVLSPAPTERTLRLTNTRAEPVHFESVSTHLGLGPCGHGLTVCETGHIAYDVDLAVGQSLDLLVDARLDSLRYPCSSAVLAVIVRLSERQQACADVASWTAVLE